MQAGSIRGIKNSCLALH